MQAEQGVLPLDLPPPLTGRQFALLQVLQKDCETFGRMRTSTEVHGSDTTSRATLLTLLQELEEKGLIEREAHAWSTGRLTEKGHLALRLGGPPRRYRKGGTFPKGVGKDGGTRFIHKLFPVAKMNILASGSRNAKLGGRVCKGRHKGLPIFSVTLEEGRTCPAACTLRDRCYGGGMRFAKRIRWDGESTSLAIADAVKAHPGMMLRLHTLGDFPSEEYVNRVFDAVMSSGISAAFGFTHNQRDTPIGKRIAELAKEHWSRFSVRTSYEHGTREPIPERSAVIISHPDQAKEHNAVLCPEQQGKTKNCGTCGYCWHSQRPVAFLLHEKIRDFKS